MNYNRKTIDVMFFILFFIIVFFAIFIHQEHNEDFYKDLNRLYFDTVILILLLLFVWFFYRKTNSFIDEQLVKQQEFFKKKEDELLNVNQELMLRLYTDSLTNLHNRIALERDISDMENPKLIIIDIDTFRNINEYYGNQVGDILLREISVLLQEFASLHSLKLYRVGGDEFAFLENSLLDLERYEDLSSELINIFNNKIFSVIDSKINITINITLGLSFEKKDIFEKASMALREAKRRRIHYLCYFENINTKEEYINHIYWSNVVKNAIANDSVKPYFQPICDMNKNIIKYECLVRIVDENGESITPSNFLEVSKKIKRYTDIEKIAIQKSFAAIEHNEKVISVNIAARDMSDSDVSNFLIAMLSRYKVAKRVVFEILEEEDIANFDRVLKFVERLKSMGCKIAIDDFGAGYSNFGYMMLLKPDYLKIDGSLIRNIDRDKTSFSIVNSISSFAKRSGIKTIAEYIHNEKIFDICLDLGIDEFQGYYLGKPTENLI